MSDTGKNQQWLYRIVGIHADGTRETLREALPVHEAVNAFMKFLDST